MKLEDELRQLRIEERKAESVNDFDLLIELKEKRLNKELELLREIKSPSQKKSLFNPKKHSEIEAIKMQVVGKDFIPLIKGGYNIIAGRGGVGKSAVALTSMIKYLKLNPKAKALAIFSEDAIEEITKRSKIICQNQNLETSIIDRIYFISLDNDDRVKWVTRARDEYIIREDYINELVNFCKDENVEYITLDPLKRFHSVSENSNDDMDVLVRDCFVRVASQTSAVLLVLHHSAKSGDVSGRGASTITDTARVSWKVSRFYIKDKLTGESQLNDDKKHLIKLEIIKDNNGIEKECTIRKEHDKSIENPLNVNYNSYTSIDYVPSYDNSFLNDVV